MADLDWSFLSFSLCDEWFPCKILHGFSTERLAFFNIPNSIHFLQIYRKQIHTNGSKCDLESRQYMELLYHLWKISATSVLLRGSSTISHFIMILPSIENVWFRALHILRSHLLPFVWICFRYICRKCIEFGILKKASRSVLNPCKILHGNHSSHKEKDKNDQSRSAIPIPAMSQCRSMRKKARGNEWSYESTEWMTGIWGPVGSLANEHS
jgi:hypothetical protein